MTTSEMGLLLTKLALSIEICKRKNKPLESLVAEAVSDKKIKKLIIFDSMELNYI